jgi:hypothetical protein
VRALCEACSQPQPPDWKPGDLCVHCGQTVCHELRCFWCAKWTPAAKYCRSCGAECVEERLFGAARMLKDAGTDRFSVPKLLRELDPAQIENFTRIYQRQAVLVARHVDEVRFLERFLRHREWSAALADALTAQLPWSDALMARYATPPPPPGDDLATVKAIQTTSPLPLAAPLASLARLRLQDWSAYPEASRLLASDDAALRDETALVLAHWRVQAGVTYRFDQLAIIDILRASPFTVEAGVGIALLSKAPVAPPDAAIGAADPDIAFAAALARGDRDHLRAALAGDELMRITAGQALIRLGERGAVAPLLAAGPDRVSRALVAALSSARKPVPELNQVLMELIERTPPSRPNRTSEDDASAQHAARLICLSCPPGMALRLVRFKDGVREVIQSVLQVAAPDVDEMIAIGAFLIERGLFRMSQYGLEQVAENGRMPDGFVPAHFVRADDQGRAELCRFAEIQLKKRGDEALHRFMLQVVYGDHPAALRSAAWSSLHRWYLRDDPRGDGPFRLEPVAIARFFGSVAAFLPRLTAVLHDRASLKEVLLFDHLANLLGYADPAIVPAIHAEESAGRELVRALLEVMATKDYYAFLRTGSSKLLGQIGNHPAWRDEVLAGLEAFITGDYYDLVSCSKRAMAAIKGEPPPP